MTIEQKPVVEDLPVSAAAQEVIHQVATARHVSQTKKLGGLSLFHQERTKQITSEEAEIIRAEIAARKELLQLTQQVDEAQMPLADVAWSPTAGMTNEGVERERDWAERAYKD